MKLFLNILMVATLIAGITPIPTVSAQGSYEKHKEEIELTASIINLERKEIIDHNMGLSNDEERGFWSLYNDYRLSMNEVGKRKIKLITDYADSIKKENLSDAEALRILKEFLSIEREKLTRREEYIPKFQKVLPPKKVVLFFQIENKLDAVLNFDLAKAIPLVK
ncbi:MAG: hypothetical protein V3U15_02355 [Nitrospinota bacterium]